MASKEGGSSDDKLRFAVECIKSVETFRPNIDYIAKTFGLSKPTAQMRWFRFRKANGIDAIGGEAAQKLDDSKAKKASAEKTPKPVTKPTKKRKVSDSNVEDDEEHANAKGQNEIKDESEE